MASGFGWHGNRSRCFTHWQEFAKCYAGTDRPAECMPAAEDYLECLHHTKEKKRAQIIQAQFAKVAEERAKDSRKAAEITADGVIVGLGLMSKDKTQEKS
ncbi:hypothetical protein Clacol_009228 [Clathrus columnatus]|uniref:NADH dehydrogenase [ubiquinone] iron-sulfur protein 5 n=1 Tax=Clathrus columnatus TaxID=1419009 RepID=A0AAV5AN66_9AGAM|nr:hypothetical protein Clacol_009228 [Clathrus columnatus]